MSKEIKINSIWTLSPTDKSSSTKLRANDLVMAWAIDKESGQPIYILELDDKHTGAKCGCLCVSCKLPLTAINVAKTEYQQRPHFKHPKGAQRDSCLVLAARYAIAQQLLELGFIELPQRKVSSRIVGLSGKVYEAWESIKPERVKIADTQFTDKATALLTLDDGRKVLVELTGGLSESISTDGSPIPTISISLGDDLSLASMSPDELKARLTLLWAGACWHSHWADAELIEKATQEAQSNATSQLDWMTDDDSLEGAEALTSEQKRETLLHSEVKRILEHEKRINLPELVARANREAPRDGGYSREWRKPSEMVTLKEVSLEKRFGRVIPDVIATVGDSSYEGQVYTLLIEVTVTNTITDERLQRIQSTNLPTLEIDIGRMGGLVTRDELVKLVVEELVAKRWLHHPTAVSVARRLEEEIDTEIQKLLEKEAARARSLEVPLNVWTQRYIVEFIDHAALRVLAEKLAKRQPTSFELKQHAIREQQSLERLQDCAYALELYGYPEANNFNDFRLRRVLDRLFSIRTNSAVGYELESCWQVINTANMDREESRTWHTLFLIAINLYKPTLTDEQDNKVKDWRTKVVDSIKEGKSEYLRATKYDALLGLLFPEMKTALMSHFGTHILSPSTKQTYIQQNYEQVNTRKHGSKRTESFWLKGKELEDWKRRYPESAKKWFKD